MWSFFADSGGTFTDVVAKTPSGAVRAIKVLSANDDEYEDAVVHGICQFLGVKHHTDIPAHTIDVVRVGTTKATNAILERRGAPTVLITTKGFADALRIGHQARPDLFARNIELHSLLYEEDCVVEARERIGADGGVVLPLDEADLTQKLRAAFEKVSRRMQQQQMNNGSSNNNQKSSSDNNIYGISAAIVFVHGYKFSQHENRAAVLAKEAGFSEVCTSNVSSPIIRFVPRGDTTVVDAYVTPPIAAYAARLTRLIPAGCKLQFMQSSGGLASAAQFRGKDAVLSGPAGGVVGMVESALAAGCKRVIGLDVGGTSADVSHYAGAYERETSNKIKGVLCRAPMMSIHTIAAGGGSVLSYDTHRLQVGPHSVGAQPGPACYGRKSEHLALTDANVLLGRIQRDYFPAEFGPDSRQKLDVDVVRHMFRALCDKINLPQYKEPAALAAAFIELAAQQMAAAVKKISVAKGYDIVSTSEPYVLNCFGGAGGQICCLVADSLGLQTILMHPLASVLSAYGLGLAKAAATRMRDLNLRIRRNLRDDKNNNSSSTSDEAEMDQIRAVCAQLETECMSDLGETDGVSTSLRLIKKFSLLVCYEGADTPLHVPLINSTVNSCGNTSSSLLSNISAAQIWRGFEEAYHKRYAHLMTSEIIATVASCEIEVDETLLAGCETAEQTELKKKKKNTLTTVGDEETATIVFATPETHVECFISLEQKNKSSVPLFVRDKLPVNAVVPECSLVVDHLTTTVVGLGWNGHVDENGILWLVKEPKKGEQMKQQQQQQQHQQSSTNFDPITSYPLSSRPDPLRLEIFGAMFMGLAEQAGIQLASTAWSVNIKERLDFSCALFTRHGELIANAPHIPVHLGSMGLSIKRVLSIMEEKRKNNNNSKDDDCGECDYFADDVFIVNDPYAGGTHLPDMTLISPVFADAETKRGREPECFVASRGHHADIGGATAGSLPPFSKSIDEEGVRLSGFRWRSNGVRRDDELHKLFMSQLPGMEARNWPQNLGDFLAQIAANERAAQELQQAVKRYGRDEIRRYMGHLLDFGETSVRQALSLLPRNERRSEIKLDNGAVVKVAVTVSDDEKTGLTGAKIDFSGSSAQLDNNFNAPRAVTLAAILYSVRLLIANNSLPLNEGCLRPLDIIIPARSCLSPEYPAPVVAGNVEMSQCVTAALLHAFGALADSQPTMNNFTFGMKNSPEASSTATAGRQYYETICGGNGAGPFSLDRRQQQQQDKKEKKNSTSSSAGAAPLGFHGASAVQSHMTNSRLTDVEILETRFPVRLDSFEIARGTGGAGLYRGGDGTRRAVTFLQPAEVCVLSNGRVFPARGLDGGGPGAPGKNAIIRAGAKKEEEEEVLKSLVQIDVEAGDQLVIQTPGGGGYLPVESE